MADSVASDPRVGTELAGYRITALLGRGGMGVVYLVEDQALGRRVALKLLSRELAGDQRFRERFRLESRLAASIDHPNVIPIYEAGEVDGELFIAMRYVEGSDLRTVLDQEGPLDLERAASLVSQVADGLDAAHTRGLVHRDVKPSNVLITTAGEREHAYLADFGLTRTASADEDRAAAALSGTPAYVAPEQITRGIADAAADVYSLGCVLYELLTGSIPFPRASQFETLWAHVDDETPRPTDLRPDLPAAVDEVVARAMAKNPAERFSSGGELAEAVRAALPVSGRRTQRAAVVVGAAAAVLAAAALAVTLSNGTNGGPSPTAPTTAPSGGALQKLDRARMKLTATIRLPGEPIDVTADGTAIWLASGAGPSFFRIDPRTSETTRGPAIPGIEVGLASNPGAVWLATHGAAGEGVLAQVGPERATNARTVVRGSRPPHFMSLGPVVADPRSRAPRFAGWFVDAGNATLRHVRRPGALPIRVDTGGTPLDLAARGDRLWVAQDREVLELRIDGRRRLAGTVSRTPVNGTPVSLAADDSGTWAVTRQGRLIRVNRGGTISRDVKINDGLPTYVDKGHPVDVAAGDDSVWVLLDDGTVDRRDPQTARSVASASAGANAVALTVAHDDVWVAVRGGAPLSKLPRVFTSGELPGSATQADCRPGRRECVHRPGVELESPEGVSALVEAAFVERRITGRSLRCGGRIHTGSASADVREPGVGRIRIAGWGVVTLRLERLVSVARTAEVAASPPVCGRITGTWAGTSGPVKGAVGRFTWTPGPSQRIVLG